MVSLAMSLFASEKVISNDYKDVALLLHSSKGCNGCPKMVVHLKRTAHLLIHLHTVTTVEVARIDLSNKGFPSRVVPR